MNRLLLCDDHRIVRDGIRWMLVDEPAIEVVAEAASGAELLAALDEVEVDVVLLDVRMPGMSGLETLAALADIPAAPCVLMLSMYDEPELIQQAVALGAAGYLMKSAGRDDLITAIEVVATGMPFLHGDLVPGVIAQVKQSPCAPPRLSEHDRAILRLMADGKHNKEMAIALGLAPGALHADVQSLLGRLGVHSRSEAVAAALRLGAID